MMNERIRQLFEENTVPNFGNADLIKTSKGEYRDPTLEDHWQTFQEAAELIVRECIDCARGAGLADDVALRNKLGFNDGISEAVIHIKKHFGVE